MQASDSNRYRIRSIRYSMVCIASFAGGAARPDLFRPESFHA